jgi:hypothetical protein
MPLGAFHDCKFKWWSTHEHEPEFANEKPGFRRGELCGRSGRFVVVAMGLAQSACQHHASQVHLEFVRRGVEHRIWYRFARRSVIASTAPAGVYRPRLNSVQSRPSD